MSNLLNRRQFVTIAGALAATTAMPMAVAGGAPAAFDKLALQQLRKHFEGEVTRGHRAGYVYALARSDGPVHFETLGYANLETSVAMEIDTGFRLASMSKAITSVAAMILVKRGLLSLQQPVAEFIPEFANTPVYAGLASDGSMETEAQKQPMNVYHLMTHTSGLDSFSRATQAAAQAQGMALFASLSSAGNLAEQVARFASVPLVFQPGTGWGYGLSTDVLGRVVEVAAGKPLQDFVRESLLEPLDMTRTFFIGAERDTSELAGYYQKSDSGLRSIAHPADNIQWAAGGMGMASTAPDYMRFLRMLANGGLHKGERLLSITAVEQLTTNRLPAELMPINVGTPYTMGAGHSLAFGVVVDDPASPPPHLVGDYRWGGSTGTAYFVSPQADLIGVILAQYALPATPGPDTMEDFESTRKDFIRLAFAAA